MKTILLLILLSLIPAAARIGETAEQLRTRYGTETRLLAQEHGYTGMSFLKNGISIHATLKDSKTVCIAYACADDEKKQQLDETTVSLLITANRGEKEMKVLGKVEGKTILSSTDGLLLALHRPADPFYKLVIYTFAYQEDPQAPQIPEPQKTILKGF